MKAGNGWWLWPLLATGRFKLAVRQYWKRILLGAVVGWLLASVGGAIALASLEVHDVISRSTSDDLGVIVVFFCTGIGALNAYALRRPAQQHQQ